MTFKRKKVTKPSELANTTAKALAKPSLLKTNVLGSPVIGDKKKRLPAQPPPVPHDNRLKVLEEKKKLMSHVSISAGKQEPLNIHKKMSYGRQSFA